MNSIYQHYIIDLSSNNNFVQVPTVQGDGNGIRGFEVELIQNGVPYVIDKNDTFIFIMGTKPDTKQIMNDCVLTDDGCILVDITSQMSAVKGRGDFQIVLMSRSTNSQLKSFPFYIITTPSAFDMDYIASSDEFQSLTRNITRTEEVIDEANLAISDVRTLESSVKKAEESRVSAENDRADAESSRISNENIRIANENTRTSNENNRQSAESNRVNAENNRISSEASRESNENTRISNEDTRKTNEVNRQTAETNRVNAEAARTSAETGRVNAENMRVTNEDARKAAETARQTAETSRNDAENTRKSNESTRQTNESARQTNTTTAITNANNAADRANNAAETCEGFIETGVVLQSEKGSAGGVATLDSNSKIPLEQIPGINLPVSTNVQTALDSYYQQSSSYTDQKIAALIGGAPSTLDTLGEIAQAMKNNENVVAALDEAVGKKASASEFDSHVKDTTTHITAVERNSWNSKANGSHTHDDRYYTQAEIDGKITFLGTLYRYDNNLDDVAKGYGVPNSKAYIFVNHPASGNFYLHGGTGHIVIGMEYGNYNYGVQLSIGIYGIKTRRLFEGTWSSWEKSSDGGNAATLDGKHFSWVGQNGQPDWVWGGNTLAEQYVYNPSNFHVAHATNADSAGSVAYSNVSGRPTFSLSGTTLTINF